MKVRSVSIAAPSLGGGGMIRAYFLADLFRYMGLDVEVVAHVPAGKSIYPLEPEGTRLKTVMGERFVRYAPEAARALSGQVIVAVKPRTSSFGVALLGGLRHNKPVVLDIDDWELSYRFGGVRQQTKQFALEKMSRLASAITVNNTWLQRRFGGTLLPSGRDGTRFDPGRFDAGRSRRALGLDNRFVLMFPGTAVPHSGLEDLLEAMESLERDDVVLVVVGGRASGRSYVSEKLNRWSERIVHLPESPIEQLPEILAAADVIVVPHRNMTTARYNFPMKLIDGMAMGKPVLATRVGDMPGALEGAGYIVEPGAPHEIADALRSIMRDPSAAAARGREARRRFESTYSLAAIAPTMERLLGQLCRR